MSTQTQIPVPNPADTQAVYQIKNNIAELQERIHTAHPAMPSLLATIHAALKKDGSLVTLLSDEEIGIIVQGLKKQTQIEIVKEKTKKTTKTLKTMDLDDLGL